MDTKSFPDNDKATANKSKRRIIWITIIVLVVAIIALVVSLFAFRTSRLEANDTKVPNIESRETDDIENKNTDYIDNEEDIYVEIIDEYWDDDIPLDTLRDKDGVYLVVPEGPEYPGGSSALFEFIKNTMVYPAAAVKDSIQGRVIVQFIVEEDGSITNPVVVKSSGLNRNQSYSNIFNQLDAEAIRIISVMPKWNPGKVEGKPCRVRYNLPINFRIEYAQIRPVELKPGTVNSDRIVYAPNGDIVDVEGIYIPADTNDIYMVVEDPPEFPGGLQALSDYLRDNIKYPEACRKDSIQGRVIISFVVEKDGSISSAEVIKSVHEQLDAEALRVISAMPKWKPGKQRGKVVRVEYAIPVKYRLDGSPYLTVPKRTDRIIENTTADIIEIVEEDSYIESIL